MSFKDFWKEAKFNFINFFSFCIVAAIIYYFFWISGQPQTANNNIGEIKTALIAVLMMIVQYYVGTTKGSAKKDETISNMQDTISKTSK